jgi:hypothetical protein
MHSHSDEFVLLIRHADIGGRATCVFIDCREFVIHRYGIANEYRLDNANAIVAQGNWWRKKPDTVVNTILERYQEFI